MRKVIFLILAIGASAFLGLVSAFGVGFLVRQSGFAAGIGMMGNNGPNTGGMELGMMRGNGWNTGGAGSGMMGGGGMMGGWNSSSGTGQRLSLDQITGIAEKYAARYGSNLEVAEVMVFSNNFYAVLQEKDTGRGAIEILLDPYSGAVSPEMGPNMMWNTKYGPMGGGTAGENPLTLEQARTLAQKALDAGIPGATVHTDGRTFYGHYTFDYDIDGRTTGMLSVNGSTGAVWFHTWHGQFIAEKEIAK
jgi:hypothetical protein